MSSMTSSDAGMRPTLLENEVKTWLSNQWSCPVKTEPHIKWGVSVFAEPFKVCTLTDLIPDLTYLDRLKNELLTLDFHVKNNDLYQYRQSDDLYSFNFPAINSFKFLLENTVRPWLEDVTNIKLSEKISATCSCYDDTDYLLCHDDQCEDRCIAYIFYLNKNWTSHDGGALQLFNTEGSEPGIIEKTILPQFNAFIFFEVSETSYHQVQEVFTMDKTRMTVNGWFYGSRKIKSKLTYSQSDSLVSVPLLRLGNNIYSSMLNSVYCGGEELLKTLNLHFEKTSSIMLEDFLNKKFYEECSKALMNTSVSWLIKGPVNHQLFEVAIEDTLDSQILMLLKLMKSEKLFQLLSTLTCLDLTFHSQKVKSSETAVKATRFSYEIRKWKAGYYSLVSDNSFSEEGLLDVTLYLNCEMPNESGGSTVYISSEEDEELLCVPPRANALSVTYRESDTSCFVKYINHYFCGTFYTISFSCVERN